MCDIHTCVCVYVCMGVSICAWERERERKRIEHYWHTIKCSSAPWSFPNNKLKCMGRSSCLLQTQQGKFYLDTYGENSIIQMWPCIIPICTDKLAHSNTWKTHSSVNHGHSCHPRAVEICLRMAYVTQMPDNLSYFSSLPSTLPASPPNSWCSMVTHPLVIKSTSPVIAAHSGKGTSKSHLTWMLNSQE